MRSDSVRDAGLMETVRSQDYSPGAYFACTGWAEVYHARRELARLEIQTAERSGRKGAVMQSPLSGEHCLVASGFP